MDRDQWRTTWAALLTVWIGMSGGCAVAPSCPPPETIPGPAPQVISPLAPSGALSATALVQKVKSQEKRIAELSLQLRLLKRIDLDRSKP